MAPNPTREPVPGELLFGTKYRLVRKIGEGGMGTVYQVVKPPEIQGVLKRMNTDLAKHPKFTQKFLDEVRILAQLDHPNIVKVYDFDVGKDGVPFYVMELLVGQTVREVLDIKGTLPPRVAYEVARQLLEALHCAHTHDVPVVHRDVKPENIFLHTPRHGEPTLKLIDFGVIAFLDDDEGGHFSGTIRYAAPEQLLGHPATAKSDLYAAGLVLYEMLAGRSPFEHHHPSDDAMVRAHIGEQPPPVTSFAPWVPASVEALLENALAKEAHERPKDALEFCKRLSDLQWAEGPGANNKPTVNMAAIEPSPAKERQPSAPDDAKRSDESPDDPDAEPIGVPGVNSLSAYLPWMAAGFVSALVALTILHFVLGRG